MKKFTLYWLTGKREVISGDSIADAFTRAGYSAGAIGALDFYYNGDNQDYVWDKDKRNWFLTEEAKIKKFGKVTN
jgi:hypothetical protein